MMKILSKISWMFAALLLLAVGFVSCNKNEDKDDDDQKEQLLEAVVDQYVNNTVITTYKSLADGTINLYDLLVTLKDDRTDANVKAAADAWIKTRDYWELSEAFLFGPASDFGIDPHIDTWPLAKDELLAELANESHINSMAQEDGDEWVANYLGAGLLGFHGIEYILFEGGQVKAAAKITDKEMVYAVAVAGDLRNQCFRLEASWAGIDNVTAEKRDKLEALELSTTINTSKYSYGEDMLRAGEAGSTKISFADACEDILEGCFTIADEVGAMKIGKPYSGEDVNYIESPYSYNSKVDFIGNIKSIQNAYLGGADKNARKSALGSYIKTVDADLDSRLIAAMDNAIAKIEAIPYPFAKHYAGEETRVAMEACNELADILTEAKGALRK